MQLYPSDKSLGYFQSSALRTLLFDMQLYPSDKLLGYFQSSALRTLLFDTQLYPSDKSLGYFQSSAARTCFADSFPTLFEVPSPSQESVPAGLDLAMQEHLHPTQVARVGTTSPPRTRPAMQCVVRFFCAVVGKAEVRRRLIRR